MVVGLYSSANALEAHELFLDATANNLSNINTFGFKRRRADFYDLVYDTMRAAGTFGTIGTQIPTGVQVGNGVNNPVVTLDFSQGPLDVTNEQLDLAIEGEGLFQITLPGGDVAYTRDGAFRLDGNRQVTTASGYLLQPPITIPPNATDVIIDGGGRVSAMINNVSTPVGQIQIAKFENPDGLRELSTNLFQESANSGAPRVGSPGTGGRGLLIQGSLERANVEVVSELILITIAQRGFQANSDSFRTNVEMLQTAIDIIPG